MNQDAPTQSQPSRIRSITIFGVLVLASISGAAFAQFTAADPIPESFSQPDTVQVNTVQINTVQVNPDPLAFGDE